MLFSRKPADAESNTLVTLPSSALNPIFGKVSYRLVKSDAEVMFTILMRNIDEGWQTGVALDASSSMRTSYGNALTGTIPPSVRESYVKKGWIRVETKDGNKLPMFATEAYDDALDKGYLRWTENVVQPEARKFVQYLADTLDADGGTTVIYWACADGTAIEEVGDVRGSECSGLAVKGPTDTSFGSATHLLPALRYFETRFADAAKGMFIFITDGRLDDLPAVKSYCVDLARKIESGERNPLKCVLIGLGPEIDEGQMVELDDLDTGTDVDIWDHKIAADMRDITEIFAELVDESMIVPGVFSLYDDKSNLIQRFPDGLPAKVVFRMPATSTSFTLEVPGAPGDGKFVQSLLMTGKTTL